jgi:cytidylate kinase
MTPRVIAIDGPAGAGKSTVSRRVAQALDFQYVDTGAMYRVVGLLAHLAGVAFDDSPALQTLCDNLDLRFEERADGLHTIANGRDLSRDIRSAEAGDYASKVSVTPVVRDRLVALQRSMGERRPTVMEGRDIGTVVFPDAPVKVFLRASVGERARRRCADLEARGDAADHVEVARQIAERDERDSGRAHSPLRPASDALTIDTTEETVDAVVACILDLAHQREVP